MEKITLRDNEEIICESKTKKELWALFMIILSASVGFFVMFLPLIPSIELAVAEIAVVLAGIAFLLPGIFLLIFWTKYIKVHKNTQLILTDKRVFIYDKSQNNYKDINLTDISAWNSSFDFTSSENTDKLNWYATFTFWTSTISITTGKITNCFEVERALLKFIPVKSNNELRRTKNNIVPATVNNLAAATKDVNRIEPNNDYVSESYINKKAGKHLSNLSSSRKRELSGILSDNEDVLCEAEHKKEYKGLQIMLVFGFAFGLFFTAAIIMFSTIDKESSVIFGENIINDMIDNIIVVLFYILGSIVALLILLPITILIISKIKKVTHLVLTKEKIIIYDKKAKHFLWFRFHEITSWMHFLKGDPETDHTGEFQFNVSNQTLTIKNVSNYFTVYDSLFKKIGKTCINPRKF